jgi:putative hemolysin
MLTTPVPVERPEQLTASTPLFRLSLARNAGDLLACQRLRYLVFNRELGEGLAASEPAGLDRDEFDQFCDHLTVHDTASGRLVGTYRMQTGARAKSHLGYYSEQLFDFTPFEPIRAEILELGRACVHLDYRNSTVLFMLWKGIARYAIECQARYLIGCSSLNSQNEGEGLALYHSLLDKYLAAPHLQTNPRPECRCIAPAELPAAPRPPRLFRAYLDVSARLCGPPAIDRNFKTIDFLTLVDLHNIPDRVRSRFF